MGSRYDGQTERPLAVSEYLVERMIAAGTNKICFVVSPGKSDIVEYYGSKVYSADVCYTVQPQPVGLCDAIFRALPFIGADQQVVVGLPDTIWFPENGFKRLEDDRLSFLLFPVEHPKFFDAVVTDDSGAVLEIQVKGDNPSTNWIWGAFKMSAGILSDLHSLWRERHCTDEYFGTLVNAYLAQGGRAYGVRLGTSYVDVGTIHGYREAMKMLGVSHEQE